MIAIILAGMAVALAVPGQVSMDSSVQLFEASLGQSVSWNPSFMSALLAWLGGSDIATSYFCLLNAVALYGSMALASFYSLSGRGTVPESKVETWRVLLCSCLMLNPVIFIYAGIIWKDVLFASLICGAGTTALAAYFSEGRFKRTGWISISLCLLGAATLTRQQGFILLPALFLLAWFAASYEIETRRARAWIAVGMLLFIVSVTAGMSYSARQTIAHSGAKGFSVGISSIMDYDIAGTTYYAARLGGSPNSGVPERVRESINEAYSPKRIDFLFGNPAFANWAFSLGTSERIKLWWSVISTDPSAYLLHRRRAFAALLDISGVDQCLPMTVGIEGNPKYLESIGLSAGTNSRAQMLYRVGSRFFTTPVFRHWVNVIWLAGLLLAVWFVRVTRRLKLLLGCFLISAAILVLVYLPTTIACDYRYLFALVPILTTVSICMLLAPRHVNSSRDRLADEE